MALLAPFNIVIYMTDGWKSYEKALAGKLHVVSKRYTQRIERHNLNLRQHLARLTRKTLSFSKCCIFSFLMYFLMFKSLKGEASCLDFL